MVKRKVIFMIAKMYFYIGVNVVGLPELTKLTFYAQAKERNIRQRYSY